MKKKLLEVNTVLLILILCVTIIEFFLMYLYFSNAEKICSNNMIVLEKQKQIIELRMQNYKKQQ